MTNGERIRKARTHKGITQKGLADKLGVSYVVISQYERGKRNPKFQALERIAEALNVPVEQLLGRKVTLDDVIPYDGPDNEDSTSVGTLEAESDVLVTLNEKDYLGAIGMRKREDLKEYWGSPQYIKMALELADFIYTLPEPERKSLFDYMDYMKSKHGPISKDGD